MYNLQFKKGWRAAKEATDVGSSGILKDCRVLLLFRKQWIIHCIRAALMVIIIINENDENC